MILGKLDWCLKIKDSIRFIEPSERLSRAYLSEAKSSLLRAHKNFSEGDLLWATVVLYYAEYYALYAFLQRIGVKCENHSCSIKLAAFLLGGNNIGKIESHKANRIDAQYYMRVGAKESVALMLDEAKMLIAAYDLIIAKLSEEDIGNFRDKIRKINKA